MVGNAVVFVFFAILLQYTSSDKAIHCLECNSKDNSMCMFPKKYDKVAILKNIPIIECGHGVINQEGKTGEEDFFCRKVVQKSLSGSGEVTVSRGCGWVRSETPCHTEVQTELNANVTTCQCFKDYCNGAAAHAVLLSLTVGAIAVYVVV